MEFTTPGYENLELSTQLLIKEAFNRNIEVDILDAKDNFIRIKRGDKIDYIKQATRTAVDSYISALIMENKVITKNILNENGINVPGGDIYNSIERAFINFEKFKNNDIVIKPKSTNFGKGITIVKKNSKNKDYLTALKTAFKYDDSVIVEEFINGKEYRFLIIDDEVVGILHREAANVVGDGVHNITELVEEKNKSELRGKGYKTPLEKISLGNIEKYYLNEQGITFNYIPQKNEKIYLRKNSNISTGGDSIDFTDDVIDEYKKIAVKAAKFVGAKICGADIIITDIKKKPSNDNYGIIELNFNPAIHIHSFPFKGKNRHPAKKILDLLGYKERVYA